MYVIETPMNKNVSFVTWSKHGEKSVHMKKNNESHNT